MTTPAQYLYLPANAEFTGTIQADGSPPMNVPGATSGQVLVSDANGNLTPQPQTGSGFANPMTTAGDLIKGGTSGAATRLPIGGSGQVLTVSGGTAVWANNSAGFANPMSAPGDLIAGGTAGSATRLPAGTTGQVLTSTGGTAVSWQNSAAGFSNPMTTLGDIITSGNAGLAQRLGVGTPGQVLTVSGGTIPAWANASSGFSNPMTTAGDIITATTGGTPQRLAIGGSGQVLTSSGGTAVSWANAPSGFTNPMNSPGDLISGGLAGVAGRVPIGAAGQVLTVATGGSAVTWTTPVTGFSNPMTTAGDIITGGTSGAAQRLAKGTNGQVLGMVSGAPAWTTQTSFSNPMTTAGDIITGGSSGTAQRLAIGSAAQVLTVNPGGTAPVWANASSGFSNPMTTAGDIIVGGSSGTAQRLGAGANGKVLTSNGSGSTPSWQTVTTGGSLLITPTGDTTGNSDANAIMNAISANGFAWLSAGQFYVKVNIIQLNNNTLNKAMIMGSGPGTYINAVGSGTSTNQATIIYMHGTGGGGTGADVTKNAGGCIRELLIDGTNAGNFVTGIDIGDAWGYRMDHVFVQNFAGNGSIGLRIGNDSYFTEKMVATAVTSRNNSTQVYMDTTVNSDPSHGYCDLDFYMHVPAGSNGLTLDDNANAGGLNLYGGSLKVRGNHETSSTALTGNWICGLLKGSDFEEMFVDWRMEGNGGNNFSATKLYFGNSAAQITDSFGLWDVTGAGGNTNGTSGQFHFAGIVKDSSMAAIRTSPADGWFT